MSFWSGSLYNNVSAIKIVRTGRLTEDARDGYPANRSFLQGAWLYEYPVIIYLQKQL
jgi:hypothetical protein